MVPGPVFWLELSTTARRGRYHFMRIGFGFSLLLVLWLIHWVFVTWMGTRLTISQMAGLAHVSLLCVAVYQELVVLLLAPLLAAGAIAEAKQRRILHDLLTSDLTSAEIVGGKLLVRFAHLVVFLLVSLPVLSMLSLLGGVDPALVRLVTAGSLASAFCLTALAVLLSTLARRVRDALFCTYALVGFWLASPYLIRTLLPTPFFVLDAWLQETSDALELSGPVGLVLHLISTPSSVLLADLTWMIAIQTVAGAIFAAAAAWLLRPVYLKQQGVVKKAKKAGTWRSRRIERRGSCWANAMLWKELHAEKARGIVRRIGQIVVALIAIVIVYETFDFAWPAYQEVQQHGYKSAYVFVWPSVASARESLRSFVASVSPFIYVFLAFSLTSASASSIATEREQDTWTALLTTLLTGREILRAKMLGAFWSARWAFAFLLVFWSVALAAGGLHPAGFVLGWAELLLFSMFAVATGTLASLHSPSTQRAQLVSFGVLIAANALGQAILFQLEPPGSSVHWLGFTPVTLSDALVGYNFVGHVIGLGPWAEQAHGLEFLSHNPQTVIDTAGLVGYSVATGLMIWAARRSFDRAAGRPMLNRSGSSAPESAATEAAQDVGGADSDEAQSAPVALASAEAAS